MIVAALEIYMLNDIPGLYHKFPNKRQRNV